MAEIGEIAGITPARFRDEIIPAAQPAVFRGLAKDWPAIRAADPAAYLRGLATGQGYDLLVGAPDIGGRFFYDAGMTALNFARQPSTIAAALDRLAAGDPAALALQSLPADEALPGFAEANALPLLAPAIRPRLWIGNRVVTALHHDVMSNIAIVVAGRRRFTLVPPAQAPNLYMGPFEFTPAATPVSLVDPDAPDLDRFPRFAEAMSHIRTAELEPGDALYIPYMWWHQVRSLDPISILANYWWDAAARPLPGLAPIDALIHAILAIGPLPDEQKQAWRAMFEAALFDPDLAHIPPGRHGIRGAVPDAVRDRLRRQLGAVMSSVR